MYHISSRIAHAVCAVAAAITTTVSAVAAPTALAQPPSQIEIGLAHAAATPPGNAIAAYDPFYDDPVPAEQLDAPGKILREQPAPHLLNVLGPEFPGYAKRILYTSTTVDGRIVPVSGAIIEPANPWAGAGPTPTVVFGPGTRGSGDACAPSRGPWMLGQIDPESPAVGINYELPNFQAAAYLGMRVVVTDYIGLGTPGAHTYVLNDEEGHAMLDAARAGAPHGHPVGFWGYSQGGGAAAAAAELAPTYAPDLNIKGAFVGAPPADLLETIRGVDNSSIQAVIGYALNGWTERFPHFQPVLERNLNARGQEFFNTTTNSCMADGAVRWGFQDTRTMTTTGEPIADILAKSPDIMRELERQRLGGRKPAAPIMVSTPGNDDLVPSPQVVQMARDHCSLGSNVTLLDDGMPPVTPGIKLGVNHAAGIFTQFAPSMMWLTDRFNDLPAASNCGTF